MKKTRYLGLALLAILLLMVACSSNKSLKLAEAAADSANIAYNSELYSQALETYLRARDYYEQANANVKPEESLDSQIELMQRGIAQSYLKMAEAEANSGASSYEDEFYANALESFTLAQDYYDLAEPMSLPADSIQVNKERIQINIALTYRRIASESDGLSMYDEALADYQQAADIYSNLDLLTITATERDDQLLVVYNNMAITSEKANRYEDALLYYDKVLEFEPGNETVLYTKYAILKNNIKDEQRAYQVLNDYAEASQNYNAYLILARAYKENGDNATAGTYYDRALQINKSADAYTRVADFYREIGNYQKSNAILEEFVATGPDNSSLGSAYRAIAMNYDKMNNSTKRMEYYDKSLSVDPNPDVALILANHHNRVKNWNSVINYATQVINLDPSNSAAFLLRGNAYYMKKNYDAARTDLTRIQNDPSYGNTARELLKAIK